MSWQFSKATEADVPELNQLVNAAYRGEGSKKGWTTEADLLDGTRIDQAALSGLLKKSDTTVLLCRQGVVLLGCVELRQDGGSIYLGMLSVNPDMQGKGIGKKLLEEAERHAAAVNCSKIYMTVISVRQELIDWYVRHGYQLTGERKPFIVPDARWGIPKQELEFVVLEKKLS
jgi:ribosomal protein S18 acetylase RimI-like enzyme